MSDIVLLAHVEDDAREGRARAAYDAARQQSIFAYKRTWAELGPEEREAWSAIAEQVAEVSVRQLATSHALEAYWQQRNHEAWVLIGELSYGLQYLVGDSKTLTAAKKAANSLRNRIDAALDKKK